MKRVILQYDPFVCDSRIIYAEDDKVTDMAVISNDDINALGVAIAEASIQSEAEVICIHAPEAIFTAIEEAVTDYSIGRYNKTIGRIERI